MRPPCSAFSLTALGNISTVSAIFVASELIFDSIIVRIALRSRSYDAHLASSCSHLALASFRRWAVSASNRKRTLSASISCKESRCSLFCVSRYATFARRSFNSDIASSLFPLPDSDSLSLPTHPPSAARRPPLNCAWSCVSFTAARLIPNSSAVFASRASSSRAFCSSHART